MGCVINKAKKDRPLSASSWTKREGWVENQIDPLPSTDQRDNRGRVIILNDRIVNVSNAQESKFHDDYFKVEDQPMYSEKIEPLEIKNAKEIRSYLSEERQENLFVDSKQFPSDKTSLCRSGAYNDGIEWIRPQELIKNPTIFHEFRTQIIDVIPGFVQNLAFALACSTIVQHEDMLRQIIPAGQDLSGENYNGLIKCRFWRFGTWIDVFVDDRLPIISNRLAACKSSVDNEFWISLCEKAYAKLNNVYEALEYCRFVDILVDFTGFIVEAYNLNEPLKNLYKILCRALASGAAISSFLRVDWENETDSEMNSVDGQTEVKASQNPALYRRAYNIISLKRVKRKMGIEYLMKIRNPWSLGREWSGPWSDNDHRWTLVDEETKKWLQFVQKDDGQYWMSFRDFCYYFSQVTICTNAPYCDPVDAQDSSGKILSLRGSWKKSINSGGSREDLFMYSINPQYLVTVFEPDPIDSSYFNDDHPSETTSVLISLMQEFRPNAVNSYVKILHIGFTIYVTADPEIRLPIEFFLYNHDIASTAVYPNSRQITKRFELEPGYYVFIPSTYAKDQEADFLIRAFSNKRISIQKLPDHEGPPPHQKRHNSKTSIVPPAVVHPASINNIESFHYDGTDWDPSTEISRFRPLV